MNGVAGVIAQPASESTLTTLNSLARHYADIAEVCSLVLHLEVRMHCFHHLLAIAHGGHDADYYGVIDKMEPDENVTRLNKDLTAIDDAMQQSLQSRKFRSVAFLLLHIKDVQLTEISDQTNRAVQSVQ